MEERRPERKDLAKPWCGSICPHRLSVTDWYTLMGASACSATPTCMGDHKSLEAGGVLVEEEWKWKWLR